MEFEIVLRYWLAGLKIAIGAALVYLIVSRVDARELGAILGRTSLPSFALACLLLCAAVISNALRWRWITLTCERGISVKIATIGYFESMFFNQVLPTGIGGDAIRIVRAHDNGMPAGWAIISVMIDRAFGLLAMAVVLLAAFAIGGSLIARTEMFRLLAALGAIVVAGALAALALGVWLDGRTMPRWTQPVLALLRAFAQVFRSPRTLGGIVATLLASSCVMAAAFVACATSVGVTVDFWDSLVIMQGILLAALVPVSIGGWGVREGAVIYLFTPLSVAAPEATAVSVLFGLALTVVGLLGAVVWLTSGYRHIDLSARFNVIKRKSAGVDS